MNRKLADHSITDIVCHSMFVTLGIILLLTLLIIVAVSTTPAQNAASLVVQRAKSKTSAIKGDEKTLARANMHPDGVALSGPVKLAGADQAGTVAKSLTGVNVLINNNNGTSGCEFFTQSETRYCVVWQHEALKDDES